MGKKHKENKKMSADILKTVDICYPESTIGGDIEYTKFRPIGFDHTLQNKMTELLHRLIMKYSDRTMTEMGFMHQIALLVEDGKLKVRMYFHPELATTEIHGPNGKVERVPIPQLGIMNGYFFALTGDPINLKPITGIEQIMAPKAKIKHDDRGLLSLRFKETDNNLKLQDALYVECNLMLVIAAIMDLSLQDPNYQVKVSTVSHSGKNEAIMVDGRKNAYQIWICVEYSADRSIRGYDPADCIQYLTAMAYSAQDRKDHQKNLMAKAVDDAEKREKKKKSKNKNAYRYL